MHPSSFHPKHLKASIPYGEMLCLRRNCSRSEDLEKYQNESKGRFLSCGYSKDTLDQAITKANSRSREAILFGTSPKGKDTNVRLFFTYSKQEQQLRQF